MATNIVAMILAQAKNPMVRAFAGWSFNSFYGDYKEPLTPPSIVS